MDATVLVITSDRESLNTTSPSKIRNIVISLIAHSLQSRCSTKISVRGAQVQILPSILVVEHLSSKCVFHKKNAYKKLIFKQKVVFLSNKPVFII